MDWSEFSIGRVPYRIEITPPGARFGDTVTTYWEVVVRRRDGGKLVDTIVGVSQDATVERAVEAAFEDAEGERT